MSIQTTDERHVSLYDSVTGIAFGPVFEGTDAYGPRDEAAAFVRWWNAGDTVKGQGANTVYDRRFYFTLSELPTLGPKQQKDVADTWRKFLADHDEDVCPFDGDDVDEPGWTNARDGSDGLAMPRRCQCECHDAAVRYAEDKFDREASR